MTITQILKEKLNNYLKNDNLFPKKFDVSVVPDQIFGDYATNLALILAKPKKKSPKIIAEEIISSLINNDKDFFDSIKVAGPGFINFKISNKYLNTIVEKVLTQETRYGKSNSKKINYELELVSANPTGRLHIGHGRNAAIGDSCARILKFAGYNTIVEYYVNDAGNQIEVLARTVFISYLNALNIPFKLPDECYKGEDYKNLAKAIIASYGTMFLDNYKADQISDEIAENLFQTHKKWFKHYSLNYFLDLIKSEVKMFRVTVDNYISEQSVYDNHLIDKVLSELHQKEATYKKDAALWLKTTEFGDDKDRVLIKSDGKYTYLLPDLASHWNKILTLDVSRLINIWGADHHGYIKRLKTGLELLGYSKNILDVKLIQMVRLIKDDSEFKMSKRKGTAIWLNDLVSLVGVDAARYMFVSKSPESKMDIDLNLLTEKSVKNKVFYAQYATARCNSLLKKANELNLIIKLEHPTLLNSKLERELLLEIDHFNDVVEETAVSLQPHLICDYIQNICKKFHAYYNDTQILSKENLQISNNRLLLVRAILQVLINAFNLIALDIKESM